ncbi:hypothetical protein [Nocardioides speluncae]|uniref:hypothetical protein n=1 Tax=Nocardioides speluncae TaxID=2670337 RepID=UPI0012B17C11|nr:hypothetical protein [Nocardioides speluncae]
MLGRSQSARYRLVAASVTLAAGLALVAAPAGAVPDHRDPKASSPTKGPAAADCSTSLFGVSTGNRIMSRSLEDDRVVGNHAVPRRLPFAVTSMGYGESASDINGSFVEILSQNADRTPRLITVRYRNNFDDGRWTARPLANRDFRHRLLTGSTSNYFAVDAKGVLRRWHLLRNDRGQRYLGSGKAVRRGLGGLKTLTHYGTFVLGGFHTAVLFGTTRSGGLVQIRVVDRNTDRTDEPVGQVRLVWLRKTGYGRYDTATVGNCNWTYNQAAITLVDRDGDRARTYKLSQALTAPSGKRLVDVGQVGPNAHWQLRAAF